MKFKKWLVFILLACVISLSIFSFLHSTKNVEFIAHRGNGYYENSIESFSNSTNFFGIECDVRITKDKKLIINHDSNIKFDNNKQLTINESTLSELTTYKIQNKYRLCSFKEYLQICKKLNKTAIIELKVEFTDEEIDVILSEINEYYSKNKCIIISFEKSNLLKLKNKTNIPLQLLFNNNVNENVQFCIDNKIHASMDYKIIYRNVVNKLHSHGLKVGAWTVNDFFNNFRMKNLGVDYITSDTLYS